MPERWWIDSGSKWFANTAANVSLLRERTADCEWLFNNNKVRRTIIPSRRPTYLGKPRVPEPRHNHSFCVWKGKSLTERVANCGREIMRPSSTQNIMPICGVADMLFRAASGGVLRTCPAIATLWTFVRYQPVKSPPVCCLNPVLSAMHVNSKAGCRKLLVWHEDELLPFRPRSRRLASVQYLAYY